MQGNINSYETEGVAMTKKDLMLSCGCIGNCGGHTLIPETINEDSGNETMTGNNDTIYSKQCYNKISNITGGNRMEKWTQVKKNVFIMDEKEGQNIIQISNEKNSYGEMMAYYSLKPVKHYDINKTITSQLKAEQFDIATGYNTESLLEDLQNNGNVDIKGLTLV